MENVLLKKNLSQIQQLFNLLQAGIDVLDTSHENFLKIQNFIDSNDALFAKIGNKIKSEK